MSQFKIEHGIPLPPKRSRRLRGGMYPLEDMEVDDSFKVPANGRDARHIQISVMVAAKKLKAKKMRFTTRAKGNTVRVWRIK